MKFAFFCMGLLVASLPLAARGDDSKPAPAPAERFVLVDGTVAGNTYNELATGTSTSGYGVKAVAEIPIVGHNWAAQVDYRSYSYQHTATSTATPNGITFGCPVAGDPGCVTPIGYQTYNRAFSPGPVNYLNPFQAQDSTTQIAVGSKIAPVERYYLSVGYIFRGSNAPGYPTLGGMGFGLDKLPDVDRTFSIYGNFWTFFNVGGKYTGPSSAALGGFSGYPFTESYRMFTYRIGATFKIPATPFFVDLSDVGDRSDVTSAAPSDALHNAVMIGAGYKF